MDQQPHEALDKCVEITKNRLYFSVAKTSRRLKSSSQYYYVSFDDDFKYRNYFHDFGPLNLACVYRYCCKLTKLLQNYKGKKKVVHYTCTEPNKKVNAAYLMGCFAVVCLRMSPMEIHKLLLHTEPYKHFVDALQRTSVHTIRLYDCLAGISKAMLYNLFDFNDFNAQEYECCDLVENGNMNWIVPRKFLAFLGPSESRQGLEHSPQFYLEYFLQNDVKTVIRLNDKLYSSNIFTKTGIDHFDLFFDDGSVPSADILLNFLRITETAPAAIAVHCKAGLGRTGTLIGAYLMKHYSMAAREAIAWLRICRPGSVTGSQQKFLETNEKWLFKIGSEYRIRHYGDETRMPQHKYGVYSRQWPSDRDRILAEMRKKCRINSSVTHCPKPPISEKEYLKHVTKLLSSVRTGDDEKIRKLMVSKPPTPTVRHKSGVN